jgi:hypothetical protein
MAQHGYLREYDEGWDRGDDRDRERSWRGEDRDRGDFLFGERGRSRDDDRGFFDPMGDEAREMFSDDDRHSVRRSSAWEDNGDWPGGRSNRSRGASSHPDDHYRSWRDRQVEALDRDYEDYCREREQQFHQDFDAWRRNRQSTQQQQQQQQQQQGGQGSETAARGAAELELTHERAKAGAGNTPSPTAAATLGTNNSENTARGRR